MVDVCYAGMNVVVVPPTRQVRVGRDLLTPEPKVFDLLMYLLQHKARAVPKAELLRQIWTGEIVEEGSLTRCVSCLRKLLGDDAKKPKFIRTVQKYGYEFIAPVNIVRDADPADERAAPARFAQGDVFYVGAAPR